MPILGATATTIIFVVGGLALLTFTVREIMQARKLIAQGGKSPSTATWSRFPW